jgi:hypothetical protein
LAASSLPQSEQSFDSTATGVSKTGSCIGFCIGDTGRGDVDSIIEAGVDGCSTLLPQFVQKVLPSAIGEPQLVQNTLFVAGVDTVIGAGFIAAPHELQNGAVI